ncbi:hypothetical protein L13192_05196 [Pyrenophora tritici-repentis]|nr:hypothetical protein L13192_05196 [Pyrenophora tritici-repentis]
MSMLLPYGDDDGQKVEETRSSATLSSSTDTEPTQTTPLSLKVYVSTSPNITKEAAATIAVIVPSPLSDYDENAVF